MDYDEPDFETKITSDPLMQNEIALQNYLIEKLTTLEVFNNEVLNELLTYQDDKKLNLL